MAWRRLLIMRATYSDTFPVAEYVKAQALLPDGDISRNERHGAFVPAGGAAGGCARHPRVAEIARSALTFDSVDSKLSSPKILCQAEIAQLVEHRTENAGVPSSSLGLGTQMARLYGELFLLACSMGVG